MSAPQPMAPERRRFSSRLPRAVWASLAFVALMILAIAGVFVWDPYLVDGRYRVATLTIDSHDDIVITGSLDWEVSEPIYYEMRRDRKPLHHYCLLGCVSKPVQSLEFELLQTDSRDFVAIVEKSDPDRVLFFFDFASGTNWPNDEPRESVSDDSCDSEPLGEYYARMNRILDRLRVAAQRPHLVLSHESRGGRIF